MECTGTTRLAVIVQKLHKCRYSEKRSSSASAFKLLSTCSTFWIVWVIGCRWTLTLLPTCNVKRTVQRERWAAQMSVRRKAATSRGSCRGQERNTLLDGKRSQLSLDNTCTKRNRRDTNESLLNNSIQISFHAMSLFLNIFVCANFLGFTEHYLIPKSDFLERILAATSHFWGCIEPFENENEAALQRNWNW